jgi:transposase InsO family protein
MVARLLAGEKARAIARGMGCSPTTVCVARDRWFAASEVERQSGRWCAPRRPVPGSCPWALGTDVEQRILDARAKTNWGPMRLAALTGRHRATIWKVLKRHGVSRRRRGQRQTFKRFEWSQPGALLHIDAYGAPKFSQPGHRVTGDRDKHNRARNLGKTVVIAVQDDHSRLVYAELHSAENAANVSIILKRAAAWMREQGCGPLQAVLSDNAKCYTGHLFARALADSTRWNGKLERFFGTLEDEWAHGRAWPNSTTRDRALSSFLRYYNRWRPHSAANGRPPITRVHQDRRQDN